MEIYLYSMADQIDYMNYFSEEEIERMDIHPELDRVSAPDMNGIRRDLDFGAYDSRGPNFDSDDAYRLGIAYGDMIQGMYVVGRDHRTDSKDIEDALIQGLNEQGVKVLDVGLAPTDMVSYIVQSSSADAGAIATASHMPPDYHGIKPLNAEGRIFDASELDMAMENFLGNQVSRPAYIEADKESSGEFHDDYIDAVVSRYYEIFEEDLKGVSIGVDPGHGMAATTVPEVLEKLGLNQGKDFFLVNDELDPEFPDRNPDPTEENLQDLSNLVLEQGLDLGVALDGDADRVVYINEKGEKVSGDESLAILGEKYLETVKDNAAASISANSSALVQEHINAAGGVIDYEPVGAVFPAKTSLKDKSPKTVFGGQPNGHYLDPEFTPYDSGTLFSTIMPGIIKEKNQKLSELQEKLPKYIVQRKNIPTENKEQLVKELNKGLDKNLLTENGVIKGLKNGQVITMRPSGTEPVVRLTVETPNPNKTIKDLKNGKQSMEMFKN